MNGLKKYRDSLTGIALLIVSAFYFKGSFIRTSQLMTAQHGPEFLPRIYSAVLAGLSIILIAGNIRDVKKNKAEENPQTENGSLFRVLATVLLVLVYIMFMKRIGFLVSSAVYMILQLCLAAFPGTTKRDYAKFVLFGIVAACVLSYLFIRLFSLALPRGMAGF